MSGPDVPLVAVDVGNSRIKFGLFLHNPSKTHGLPAPDSSLTLISSDEVAQLSTWLAGITGPCDWRIASVQRTTTARLLDWLKSRSSSKAQVLSASQLPLEIRVEHPERVGMDRLANAVAANRLRVSHRSAIVIDVGSAITVDAVSADGAFLGGAIFPGIRMAAQALHERTDLLPLSEMKELEAAPEVLGQSTTAALRSGLFWGAVGAMRKLISRLSPQLLEPQVLLTGGAAPSVAQYLTDAMRQPAQFVPHLTLGGIALCGGK